MSWSNAKYKCCICADCGTVEGCPRCGMEMVEPDEHEFVCIAYVVYVDGLDYCNWKRKQKNGDPVEFRDAFFNGSKVNKCASVWAKWYYAKALDNQ